MTPQHLTRNSRKLIGHSIQMEGCPVLYPQQLVAHGNIYGSTSWLYNIFEFSSVEILHSFCCFFVQAPGQLLSLKRLKQSYDICKSSAISFLSLSLLPFFLLHHLDTIVLWNYLIVRTPKKFDSFLTCAGQVLRCVAFLSKFTLSNVISFLPMKLSWSLLCPSLVNSSLIMNKTFKVKDEENPAYQNLHGRTANFLFRLTNCRALLG